MLAERDFLQQGDAFSDPCIQTDKTYKFETEIWPWEARPHPFEFITTYSC